MHGLPERAGAARKRIGYAYYVVLMLTLAYMLSFMDRVLVSLMIDPIRADLRLGDTQIGLLVGFGFVLLYSVMGIPFGVWADSGNRRNLILFGLIGWSLATALCGFAGGFASLLAARAFVGIGEAALSPAAYSTIADRFEKSRLGFAISLYAMGVSLGGGVAMMFGGYLVGWAQTIAMTLPGGMVLSGWRMAFVAVGLLGVPLALLMLATMREAPRTQSHIGAPSISALFTLMRRRKTAFLGVIGGYSAMVIAAYGALLWGPAHFARAHGMAPAEIGLQFGLITGLLGSFGLLAAGLISDRLARRDVIDAPVRVVMGSIIIQLPLLVSAFLASDRTIALVLIALGMTATSMIGGLQAATLQILVPADMRGRLTAIYLLCVNLAGMGIGPLLVGLLSEHVYGGATGLGKALATISGLALALALTMLAGTRRAILSAIRAHEESA
ncbi:spinster family MFS transporter [Sphingobium sp.]|uniref:spinster family MFS transporter n=1 Tax=Sphingobium sp. TaxID=1912891 RepID=UPI0035C6D3E9